MSTLLYEFQIHWPALISHTASSRRLLPNPVSSPAHLTLRWCVPSGLTVSGRGLPAVQPLASMRHTPCLQSTATYTQMCSTYGTPVSVVSHALRLELLDMSAASLALAVPTLINRMRSIPYSGWRGNGVKIATSSELVSTNQLLQAYLRRFCCPGQWKPGTRQEISRW